MLVESRPGSQMKRAIAAVAIGLAALSAPRLSSAQTVDEILSRVQQRLAQDAQGQASWSAEQREAADKARENLKADRCADGETGAVCDMVVLCSKTPEIAGEKLPDDRELTAANKALDDVENDLTKLAGAISRVKIAAARFQKGAHTARDRCESKVRIAYRSKASAAAEAKSEPDDAAAETSGQNPIYDGPVAIRPMVTAPRLMGRVPPVTSDSQPPAARQ